MAKVYETFSLEFMKLFAKIYEKIFLEFMKLFAGFMKIFAKVDETFCQGL